MHSCSLEFGNLPENVKLADEYGIVAGSAHCEQMLANNINWNVKVNGSWDYGLNRDTIHAYWEDSVKARRSEEAVWTLGIRGIHDRAMQGANDMAGKIKLMSEAIADQPPVAVEVPGSDGSEDKNGKVRKLAVQDNCVRVRVPVTGLTAGNHTFTIRALDPGAVIDRVSLP